jgi:hypothetical protein
MDLPFARVRALRHIAAAAAAWELRSVTPVPTGGAAGETGVSVRGSTMRTTGGVSADDDRFIQRLEAGTLPPVEFGHRGHLRAGFLYLRRHDFPGACVAMKRAIQVFAATVGKATLYHETLTIAYLALIAERLFEEPAALPFEAFIERYPELANREYFERYYPRGTLDLAEARATFILPRPRD